ncbi:MAG: kynureninase [Proteobacteria bacterium]|nr:kynureninase [Pseudomonadota bacterium]
MNFEDNKEFARKLDEQDPLRAFRDQFNFPPSRDGNSPVYLCGNSLGLQPKLAKKYVLDELANWANYAVDGHFHSERPWIEYHRHATRGFADLTGSKPSEVIAMNTLTVNLHFLMASFYRPTNARHKILIEEKAFPSDRYAAQSQIRMHGFDPEEGIVEWKSSNEDGWLALSDLADILEREGDSIALLLLPGVQYYTGQVLEMAEICRLGRDAGCVVGLDLAHAIGNVELHLNDWAPDFAAWCTYKYLNAGPGAIGGAFINVGMQYVVSPALEHRPRAIRLEHVLPTWPDRATFSRSFRQPVWVRFRCFIPLRPGKDRLNQDAALDYARILLRMHHDRRAA